MWWEKIVIEGHAKITIEKDLMAGIIRWRADAGNKSAEGVAETLSNAIREAVKAAESLSKVFRAEVDTDWSFSELMEG